MAQDSSALDPASSRSGAGKYRRAAFAYFRCPRCTKSTWHPWVLGAVKPVLVYCPACSSFFSRSIVWTAAVEAVFLLLACIVIGVFGALPIASEGNTGLGVLVGFCVSAVFLAAAWPAFCRKNLRYEWALTIEGKFEKIGPMSAIVPGFDPSQRPAVYDPNKGWKKYIYMCSTSEPAREVYLPAYRLRVHLPERRCCVCVRHGPEQSPADARLRGWVVKQALIDSGIAGDRIEIRTQLSEFPFPNAHVIFGGDDDFWWDDYCGNRS